MQILSGSDTTNTTTDTNTLITTSIINAQQALSVSFTIKNVGLTNSLNYQVIAGNLADLSDGIVIQSVQTVATGAVGSYSVQSAPFGYYGIKQVATSAGNQTDSRIIGRAKG